jgi:hypothetical protein
MFTPTTFLNQENSATSALGADHTVGDGILHLQSGDGIKFGSKWPARVTAVHPTTGAVVIYQIKARSADQLAIDSTIEDTTDITLPAKAAVGMYWTAGGKAAIEDAINALESGTGMQIGTDSVAIGQNAITGGVGAVAQDGDGGGISTGTLAAGHGSIASGSQCLASANNGHAFGSNNVSGFPAVEGTISGTLFTVNHAHGDVTAQFPAPSTVVLYRLANAIGPTAATATLIDASFAGANTELSFQSAPTQHTAGWIVCPDATDSPFTAGSSCIASGAAAAAFGLLSRAPGAQAFAAGKHGYADLASKFAIGGGVGPTNLPGDCQATTVVISGVSTDANPVALTLAGIETNGIAADATNLPLIRPGTAYAFDVTIIGYKIDGSAVARFRRAGLIKSSEGGTTALVGAVETLGADNNAPGWSVAVAADNTNDALLITVTGEAIVRWVARLDCVEVA